LPRSCTIIARAASPPPTNMADIKKLRGLEGVLQSEWGRVAIAGSGFLADGYDLFIIGLVEIIMDFEYVQTGIIDSTSFRAAKGTMASAALAGAVLGQLFFGALADRVGRRIVFIVTAALIIVGSVASCLAQTDLWAGGPEQLFTQIAIARFVMGVGIGGEYPLSATIAAEGCSKRRSGTLMAVVFSNQGWGYLLAVCVMLFLVGNQCPLEATWRIALGFGAVVPAIALPFRMMMHESESFEQVQKDRRSDVKEVDTKSTMRRYVWHLVGTAMNWFLWDIVWYSNGLFSQDIADVLQGLGTDVTGILVKKLIIVLCMLPGFFLSIALLNRIGRKNIQILGYVATSTLFFICAFGYDALRKQAPFLFFVLYAMTFLFANFGPNTTTYVIPGEVYPSQIKATFHGISAASGKLGGVLGAAAFPLLHPEEPRGKVLCLFLCAAISLIGAIFTVVFTPRYKAEDLEPLRPNETVGFVPLRFQKRCGKNPDAIDSKTRCAGQMS